MSMKTDEQLMQQYIQGDSEAFSQLYNRYKSRVYGYLNGKVDPQKKDDMFQAIFLKLHKVKHLYKIDQPFAPWFFTVIKHHIIDESRKFEPVMQEHSKEIENVEINYKIDIPSFLKISKEDQNLLYKKFVEEYDYNELADELSKSSTSLRKKVSRLLKTLKIGAQR